jgi:glyoxylase-like metal-dependent hydrolase (beta-lactamase superfamily II)
MEIKHFFDPRTYTLTYVVYDLASKDAVVIDPVLDYEPASSKVWTESAEEVVEFLKAKNLNLRMILETHAHADHLSGSKILKKAYPEAKLAVGKRITEVQKVFKGVFDLPDEFPTDGRQFDVLLENGETMTAGTLSFETIFTPGHTPACATFKFGNNIFTGDALFMADSGTGRCDFPGGSSADLYNSIVNVLYRLPDDTKVWVGHDYQPDGREVKFLDTIANEKANNVALRADMTEREFVEWRNKRDSGLSAPKLLFQSVQVNVDGGKLPDPHANEVRYLKIPINVFRPPQEGELKLDLV